MESSENERGARALPLPGVHSHFTAPADQEVLVTALSRSPVSRHPPLSELTY